MKDLVQKPVVLQNRHPGVGPKQEVDPHGQHDKHHGRPLEALALPAHHIAHRVADNQADQRGDEGQLEGPAKDHGVGAHLGEVLQSEAAQVVGKGVDHHQHDGGHHKEGHPDNIGDGEPGELRLHLRPPPVPPCPARRTRRRRRSSRRTGRSTGFFS